MDIRYSLDGSEFGTTYFGHPGRRKYNSLCRAHMVKMDYSEYISNGSQMD